MRLPGVLTFLYSCSLDGCIAAPARLTPVIEGANHLEGRACDPRGASIIAALKSVGVSFVISVPDIVTSEGLLRPIAGDRAFRLVRVAKEDEGISICAGLAFCDRRALLLIQHTGLLDSLNALRAIAVEYEQPVCVMVGLQGMEPDRTPAGSSKYGIRIVEPILAALGIDRHVIASEHDVAAIAPAIERAYERARPVVFLVSRSPV